MIARRFADMLEAWVPRVPPRPPLPDFRTVQAPPGLRFAPGFARAWAEALSTIQVRVELWADGLWDLATGLLPRAVRTGVLLGGLVWVPATALLTAILILSLRRLRDDRRGRS